MLFGMNMVNFVVFITLISFAEALYSPIINVFTFKFTKAGREGTFLTLTAAPTYFTMAMTGVVGGYLLEEYYPAVEKEGRTKRPTIIWIVIMIISSLSFICLYIGRHYFNPKEEEETTKEFALAGQESEESEEPQSEGDGVTSRNVSTIMIKQPKLRSNNSSMEAETRLDSQSDFKLSTVKKIN